MADGLLSNVCDCSNQTGRSAAGIVLDSFWKHDGSLTSLYMVAYGLVAILALVGNFLVVVAVYNTPSMHSSVNILIVNMSVGGILYAMFVLPTSLLQIVYYDWFLGAFMCKATAYIQGVVVTSVVYTLIAIAIDRYIAICGKLHANSMSKQTTLAVMLVIWLLAGALMTPFALNYEAVSYYPVEPPVTLCRPSNHWRYFNIYFTSVVFIANYTIPLCLITFCYASIAFKVWKKDKEFGTNRHIGKETQNSGQSTDNTWRVVKMMIMIVFLFAFSWLPLYTTRMIMMVASSNETSDAAATRSIDSGAPGSNESAEPIISTTELSETEYDQQRDYRHIDVLNDVLVPLSQWLSSSNCCMNPWVYCFFSPKYRRAFKRIVIYRFFGKVCSAADSLEFDGQCKTMQSHCTKCKRPCELRGPHRCDRATNRPNNYNYSRQSSGDSLADACSPMRKTSVEFIALQTHQENLDTPDENPPQSAKNIVRGAPYGAVESAECTRPLPGLIDVEIMPRKCAN